MATKKVPAKAKKPVKKDSPKLAAREEKLHRDLDGDGEKGEPKAHQRKVLGYSKAQQLGKKS